MLIVACAHAPATPPTTDLEWLVGEWVAVDGAMTTTETWRRESATLLRGGSTTEKDGNVVHTETIEINWGEDGVFYIASPSGQSTTSFRLTRAMDLEAVFENPEHDYPKKIVYERSGDELVARISGGEKSSEWRFTRR